MNAKTRREKITELLRGAQTPLSASELAKTLGVSRQVVVGDIALLRASGVDIIATPRGYVPAAALRGKRVVRTIACSHTPEDTMKEIYAIVDSGASLINVTVEHPIYGELRAELHINSRYDADEFSKKIKKQGIALLSNLTGGLHLHEISCETEEVYRRVLAALKREGILFEQAPTKVDNTNP